jgi:hypothetical protein
MNTDKIILTADLLIPKEVNPKCEDITFPAGAELTKLPDGVVMVRISSEESGMAVSMPYLDKNFSEKIWNIALWHNPKRIL